MNYRSQYSKAGEGARLRAPDATLTVKVDAAHTDGSYEMFEIDAPRNDPTPLHRTGWAKTYYVLSGRILVHLEDEQFDLGPGESVAIPPGALHTFTVATDRASFLVFSLTGAMGRFHADLDASVPHDKSLQEAMPQIFQVLARHDVTMDGMEVVQ